MHFSKRVFDIVVATLGIVLLSPLYIMVAAVVRLVLGQPILFRQQRPGYKSRPFFVYKFRTMTDARDGSGRLLDDSERLTALGRFLRSFSLDELPELFNILRGEMSFVGPRPLLMEYLPLYSPEQARRHDAVPGLTGWAQVNGRNAADWPARLAMDVSYVDNWSFWLDLKILLLTLWKVITRRDISQPGQATVEHFRGER